MTQIETFQNFKVQYVCVKGNPWFRGNDVAEILGYIRPRKAVQDHVPDKYRNTLEKLMLASGSTVSGLPDASIRFSNFGILDGVCSDQCLNDLDVQCHHGIVNDYPTLVALLHQGCLVELPEPILRVSVG